MTLSKSGIALIQHFENCMKPDGKGNFVSYPDSKGIWTIGWGSTFHKNGKRVKQGDKLTKAQVDELFSIDVAKFCQGVQFLLKGKAVTQQQFDALVSFGYNVGLDIDDDTKAEGLGDSTLLKKVLANPNDPSIKDEFIKWRNKGTSFEKGLLRRRLAEAHYYFTGQLKFEWDAEIKKIMGK